MIGTASAVPEGTGGTGNPSCVPENPPNPRPQGHFSFWKPVASNGLKPLKTSLFRARGCCYNHRFVGNSTKIKQQRSEVYLLLIHSSPPLCEFHSTQTLYARTEAQHPPSWLSTSLSQLFSNQLCQLHPSGVCTALCSDASVEKQNQKPTKAMLAELNLGVDSCPCPPPPCLGFRPAASPWRHYFIPIPSPFSPVIPPMPAALCKTAE